jgi:hypothetical protein
VASRRAAAVLKDPPARRKTRARLCSRLGCPPHNAELPPKLSCVVQASLPLSLCHAWLPYPRFADTISLWGVPAVLGCQDGSATGPIHAALPIERWDHHC